MMMRKTVPPIALPVMMACLFDPDEPESEGYGRVVGMAVTSFDG